MLKTTVTLSRTEAQDILGQRFSEAMPSDLRNRPVIVEISLDGGYNKIKSVVACRDYMRAHHAEVAARADGNLSYWKGLVEAVIAASGLA